jgi:hypothetical protein
MSNVHTKDKERARKLKAHTKWLRKRNGRATREKPSASSHITMVNSLS